MTGRPIAIAAPPRQLIWPRLTPIFERLQLEAEQQPLEGETSQPESGGQPAVATDGLIDYRQIRLVLAHRRRLAQQEAAEAAAAAAPAT